MILRVFLSSKLDGSITTNEDLLLRAKNTNTIYLIIRNELLQAVDITGDEIYFLVKDNASQTDASAKLNKKITTFTYETSGETEINLTTSDTTSLVGNYIYQLKIKHSGSFYTLSEGNVLFQKSIIDRES